MATSTQSKPAATTKVSASPLHHAAPSSASGVNNKGGHAPEDDLRLANWLRANVGEIDAGLSELCVITATQGNRAGTERWGMVIASLRREIGFAPVLTPKTMAASTSRR